MTYTRAAVERAMKVQEVILRALSGRQSWLQVADVLGVRYPDLIVAEGMYTGVTWTAEEALHAGTSLGLPAYVVTISFVDELVSEVLRCGRMTPRFFVGRYHAEGAAIQSLTYKNPRAMDWAVMPLPPTTT